MQIDCLNNDDRITKMTRAVQLAKQGYTKIRLNGRGELLFSKPKAGREGETDISCLSFRVSPAQNEKRA